MATFTSPKFRSLVVKFGSRERVRFENGEVEVSGDTADRLADFAQRHPEYQIEQTSADERETHKQRVQREARERGLDDSGTVAEIEARIAEHDAPDADAPDESDEDADDLF